ncbi:MAG: holo-ACP synthase [Campylobacterales bacterium]|nr:holo-ACP synthase [Campylobacterales bacterium]
MIGVDIVSINRVEQFVKKFEQKALDRFLSKKEQKIAKKIETIAGFWAAKEAVSKALKCGIGERLSFLDIKIKKDKSNAPYFKLSKKAKKIFKIKNSSLSISHDNGFAIAVVVIFFKK